MKTIRETGIFRSKINDANHIVLETSCNQFCTFNAVGVSLQDNRVFGDEDNKRGILEDLDIDFNDETDLDEVLIDIAQEEFSEIE